MNGKISLVLNGILLLAVIYLFTQLGRQKEEVEESAKVETPDSLKVYPSIAWVNNDSLATQYKYIQAKNIELESLKSEVDVAQGRINQSNSRYMELVEKFQRAQQGQDIYQNNEQVESDMKEVQSIEENIGYLESKLQTKYDNLTNAQLEVYDSVAVKVDRFLKEFSSDKPIDLILLYTQGQTGLYATDALDLTEEVIEGLNAEFDAEKFKAKQD